MRAVTGALRGDLCGGGLLGAASSALDGDASSAPRLAVGDALLLGAARGLRASLIGASWTIEVEPVRSDLCSASEDWSSFDRLRLSAAALALVVLGPRREVAGKETTEWTSPPIEEDPSSGALLLSARLVERVGCLRPLMLIACS